MLGNPFISTESRAMNLKEITVHFAHPAYQLAAAFDARGTGIASFQTWTIFNVTRITNAKIGDKAPSRGNVQGFVQRVGLQYRNPTAGARSKFSRNARFRGLDATTTKRQGSLKPTEGANRAASTNLCTVPAGRGSV